MHYKVNTNHTSELHIRCMCGHPVEHTIFIIQNIQDEEDECFIYLGLNHYLPWYQRIIPAVTYLFGRQPRQLMFAETMVNREDMMALVEFLGDKK